MNAHQDNAGVIAPPPLLAVAAILVGLALDWLFPAFVLTVLLTWPARIFIGIALGAGALGLTIPAIGTFRRAGTDPEPWKPSTVLVTKGVFAWLRNPIYVGGFMFLAGLAVLLASDWMMVMAIVFAVVVHFGVVKREERYLEAKFGNAYRVYKAEVPRYGIPFWPE